MISKKLAMVNEFSPALWEHIRKTLTQATASGSGKRIAAFDADGTLWDDDAGETFFRWQIANSGLSGLPGDPWAHYHQVKSVNPTTAYVWLAQISAGQTLAQVRQWAAECFASRPDWPVFQSQKKLLDLLRSLDFEIFIVTASVKWAVEPVAALVGVDFDHVLGITTEVQNGVVGKNGVLPITWRQGKADRLLAASGGIRPILACGNTYGDIALLDTATHLQLAVSTQAEASEGLFLEESRLSAEADRRGWLRHSFRS